MSISDFFFICRISLLNLLFSELLLLACFDCYPFLLFTATAVGHGRGFLLD